MNDNKNLIPLAEIAKQINKTPAYLSKLAREGTITAEKKKQSMGCEPRASQVRVEASFME